MVKHNNTLKVESKKREDVNNERICSYLIAYKKSHIFADEEGGDVKFRYFKTKTLQQITRPIICSPVSLSEQKNALIKAVSFRISKRLKVQLKVGGLWGEWASALNINAWSAKLAGQPK